MINIRLHTSLAKIFPDEICSGSFGGELYMLKNQRSSFQMSLIDDRDVECTISVKSDIAGCISYYEVKNIPASHTKPDDADNYILKKGEAGEYPDALMPVSDVITLKRGEYKALWFEFDIPSDCSAGGHEVKIYSTLFPQNRSLNIRTGFIPTVFRLIIMQRFSARNTGESLKTLCSRRKITA